MFNNPSLLDLFTILVTLIVSLTIHEFMHGFVAHKLGDDTAHREGRLSLNPLVHIDVYMTILLPVLLIAIGAPPILAAKPVPIDSARLKYDEFGMALVGLAGPLTNLALAIIAGLGLRFFANDVSFGLGHAVFVFVQLNVALFVFNLIPFPPLDGSRVLYAFAPDSVRRVMEQIEAAGFLVLLAVLFLGFQFISGPIVNIENSIIRFLLV